MNSLRVGFLGAGFMSHTHISKLLCIPDIKTTAVCDHIAGKAEELVKKYNLTETKVFADFSSMLKNCEMDCLYVCIPPFAHNGQVEQAVEMGIHVFVEKPLGLNSLTARKMADSVKNAGVHSHVGYHLRYGYAVQKLKQLIDDGTAGKPVLFDARYDCNSLHAPWWIPVRLPIGFMTGTTATFTRVKGLLATATFKTL